MGWAIYIQYIEYRTCVLDECHITLMGGILHLSLELYTHFDYTYIRTKFIIYKGDKIVARFIELWNHIEDDNRTVVIIRDKNNYSLEREYILKESAEDRIHFLIKHHYALIKHIEIQTEGVGIEFKLAL